MNYGDRIHVCGVAGVGMNALAQALVGVGMKVSGSDRFLDSGKNLPVLQKLERAGVELFPQDGSGVTSATGSVAVSTAIEDSNPDLRRARELGVPVVHRARMLAELAADERCVAIAGTSGKTTTTGMVGWILECAGMDPFVVNGGAIVNWRSDERVGNVRVGKSGLWVVEVDESDRSLLEFSPEYALITNMSADHFDLTRTEALFGEFLARVEKGVVGCLGDPSREELFRDFRPIPDSGSVAFEYGGVQFGVPMPGVHNAENALEAAVLCERIGVSLKTSAEALSRFAGIERRLEKLGAEGGVTVIDDYAHNPAKIVAAWSAVAAHHGRILGVWRPHGYGPLRGMMDDLVRAFSAVMGPVDQLLVLPVFDAGGTADRSVQSDRLVNRLEKCGLQAAYVRDYDELRKKLLVEAESGDVILLMGARDPDISVFGLRLLSELVHL